MYTDHKSRECVQIHAGQCGTHVGSTFWELMAHEHGVNLDGTLDPTVEHHILNTLFDEVIRYSNPIYYIENNAKVKLIQNKDSIRSRDSHMESGKLRSHQRG